MYLRQKIITNQLTPGSRINYDELGVELGISKTPLRDAINRLAQDGLVEIKPRSGTFVTVPNIKDAIEVYDVRKALERQVIALAINRIPRKVIKELLELNQNAEKLFLANGDFQAFLDSDREIHQTLIRYSDNSRIINIMDTMNAQISWFGFLIIDRLRERATEAIDIHRDILEAMLNLNVELAMNLMDYHIEGIKLTAISDFSNKEEN